MPHRGSAQGYQGPLRRLIGFGTDAPGKDLTTRLAEVAMQSGPIPPVFKLDLRATCRIKELRFLEFL